MNKVLNTNDIYLGGDNGNFCGIYTNGTPADGGTTINCNDKIVVGKDYNIKVYTDGTHPAPASTIIWKAWCE
jgi:hypothetical protein